MNSAASVMGITLMPGDEILSSISAIMDQIRFSANATGIVFASRQGNYHRVEVARCVPRIFMRGDFIHRIRAYGGATPRIDQAPSLSDSRNSSKSSTLDFFLESEYFTLGPIKSEISVGVKVRGSQGVITMFANHPLDIEDAMADSLLKILSTHIETAFSLRGELEGVTNRLDDAEDRAYRDSLTGLLNRHGFTSEINREQARRERYLSPVTIAVFDLDGLKAINDRYGHEAGDKYIERFASVLGSTCRTIDCSARLGGDEFAVLAPQTDANSALKMRQRFSRIFSDAELGVSMGFATVEDDSIGIPDLVILADAKMYQDKKIRKQVMNEADFLVG